MQRHRAGNFGIGIDVFAAFPGIETSPDGALTGLAKRFAGTNGHAKVAYGTEAGRFKEMLDIETVICGPGRIAMAHRPDEYRRDRSTRQMRCVPCQVDRLGGERISGMRPRT